jgi:hypothetical protein
MMNEKAKCAAKCQISAAVEIVLSNLFDLSQDGRRRADALWYTLDIFGQPSGCMNIEKARKGTGKQGRIGKNTSGPWQPFSCCQF